MSTNSMMLRAHAGRGQQAAAGKTAPAHNLLRAHRARLIRVSAMPRAPGDHEGKQVGCPLPLPLPTRRGSSPLPPTASLRPSSPAPPPASSPSWQRRDPSPQRREVQASAAAAAEACCAPDEAPAAAVNNVLPNGSSGAKRPTQAAAAGKNAADAAAEHGKEKQPRSLKKLRAVVATLQEKQTQLQDQMGSAAQVGGQRFCRAWLTSCADRGRQRGQRCLPQRLWCAELPP